MDSREMLQLRKDLCEDIRKDLRDDLSKDLKEALQDKIQKDLEERYFLVDRKLVKPIGALIVCFIAFLGYTNYQAAAFAAAKKLEEKGVSDKIDSLGAIVQKAEADGTAVHAIRQSLEHADVEKRLVSLDSRIAAEENTAVHFGKDIVSIICDADPSNRYMDARGQGGSFNLALGPRNDSNFEKYRFEKR